MEKTALNADIVDYSRLMADDLERTTAVVGEYRQLVMREVTQNQGVLTSFVGDNFMAVFDEPMNALRSSIAIATQVEGRSIDTPPEQLVRFRMGLDQGEIEEAGGDYFGEALNVAARIQALAEPGGLSVSGRVYRALDEPALRFHPRGPTRLKNIPEPVDVYDFSDLPSDGRRPTAGGGIDLSSPIVAVLPFHTRPEEAAFVGASEMIRAEMIHRLAAIPNLTVIDAKSGDVEGAVSAARYMIESGVHGFGDQIRVYSSLFDVTTMNIVKTHKWYGTLDGLLELSENAAVDLARSTEVDLIVGEPAGLYADLNDPVAIEKIYLGWYHLTSTTAQGWAKALELFSEVAELHPDQPYGHILYGFAHLIGIEIGVVTDRARSLDEAYEAAQRGLTAGDPTGMSPTIMAAVLLMRGQADEALEVIDGVSIIRPTCDATYGIEASVRRYLGQWERSVNLIDTAMRLSGATKPWYPTVKACSLLLGGQSSEASAVAEAVLERQPENLEALLVLAGAQAEQGLERRARATAQLVRERFPGVDVADWIDQNPYQNRAVVTRWKRNLASIGLIESDTAGNAPSAPDASPR